jgi:O-succinylbenzoic acid--CoA ligase
VLDALAPGYVVDEHGDTHARANSRPVEPGDALVVATSGTTGDPKGVVLTFDAVVASALATSRRIGIDRARDRWLACLPLAHVGGLSVVTRAVVTDTALTVLPGFDAAAVHDAALAGCTVTSLVSTALARIDAALFRVIVLGGARPPEDRPANTVTTYGMTETGSGIVYDGVPLDGVEVRVGDDGEIAARGPMLLRAYRDGTDPKTQDGWLPTGDLGAWTTDGGLVVHGRRGDLIITGGENVWPDAVEAALRDVSGIADVAVAGRPDPQWGTRVVAYVVAHDPGAPPQLAALRDAVRAVLPAYCAPHELQLVAAIPRTALGKPRRRDLVDPR